MERYQKTAGEALGRAIESAGRAYKELGEGRTGWDEVDLTARAWLWTNEAVRRPIEWNSRSQCMWLKDAIQEAVRRPLEVRNIEYEASGRDGVDGLEHHQGDLGEEGALERLGTRPGLPSI